MKQIVQDGAAVLREVALPLPEELFSSADLTRLIANMTAALDKEVEGVALAAPQVGVSYRLFIVRMDRTLPPATESTDDKGSTFAPNAQGQTLSPVQVDVYINPEIVKTSKKRQREDEGCLSVRGIYGVTNRHERVTLKARRPDGSRFERGASGLLAQIFEHEVDHLNGILFIDAAENLIHVRAEHAD